MASSSRNRSSGGLIGNISSVFLQPRTFFDKLPHTRHWLLVAMLILFVFGFNAANQQVTIQTFTESTSINRTPPTMTDTDGFDQSTTDQTDTQASTNPAGGRRGNQTESDTTDTQASDQTIAQVTDGQAFVPAGFDPANSEAVVETTLVATSETVEDTPTLMTSILAATDLLVLWTGQALLLSIVIMAKGYMPNISRSFQIAVWASLPLALMLILRQLFFASGGEGGSIGMITLLETWDGYSDLSVAMQQFLAIFTSNLTIFWVWNMTLLYIGARYALRGSRVLIVMILALWMILSTGVMTFTTDPVIAIEPLPQTETEVADESSNDNNSQTTTTTQTGFGNFGGDTGGFPGGGNFEPPTGGGGRGGN